MKIAHLIITALFLCTTAFADIIADVRSSINHGSFIAAESQLKSYEAQHGATPESIEAHSWLARGALNAKQLDKAEDYAVKTQQLVLDQLKKTFSALDAEQHLPMALGAAIEVQAQAKAAQGEVGPAVDFLQQQLKLYFNTSIRARIQKNLNLLSLEGKPAPPLRISEHLGAMPKPISAYRGHPVLLFFWAHWCIDCKSDIPIIRKLMDDYSSKGLVLIGPTQRYGYGAGGATLSPAAELKYIEEVRQKFYAPLNGMTIPVSEENFKRYGASTTPTLVLIDAKGIVRMYHAGAMSYEDLHTKLQTLLQ
ncbi:MAG: Redoxin domain protein [Candidatus Angelobacter sp.]|jgi:thiol-disulfide isomerase/thioredoxin|nr:Redoxin domain protein [Candidatus Angelobacter sp.]